jgi:hypothetical protein
MSYKINKNLSKFNNKIIYDRTILNYIGIQNYKNLQEIFPNLYENLINNQIYYYYTQEKLVILELSRTIDPIEIKKQIIATIVGDKNLVVNGIIKNLVKNKPDNIKTTENTNDIWIFVFVILIFILGIIYVLYILDIFTYIFSKSCDSNSCVKNFNIN